MKSQQFSSVIFSKYQEHKPAIILEFVFILILPAPVPFLSLFLCTEKAFNKVFFFIYLLGNDKI